MKKRIFALLVPFIALTAALFILIPIVKAEESAVQFQFIDSVTLTDTSGNALPADNITKTSGVKLNYHFTLPNITHENNYGIVPGAQYYMEIPPQVLITDALAKQTIPLNDSNGDTVANCTLQKGTSGSNSKVIITFTDYVLTHSQVSGYFYLQSSFDQNQIGNANPIPVVFNIGNSSSQTVDLNFQQNEVKVYKDCSAYDKSTNTITWTVTLNPENVTVNNGVFFDDIPDGLTYADSPDSFSITGSTSGALPLDSNFSYVADTGNEDQFKSGTLTYKLPINTHETYTITYKTRVTDATLFTGSGSIIKTNTAALNHDFVNGVGQATGSKTTTVTANLIKKDGSVSSNPDGTKKIDWTITVNQDQLKLSGAKVKDTIPNTLDIINGTVKVNGVTLDPSDYNYVNRAFEYDFPGDITTTQTITFSTSIVDQNYFYVNHDSSSTFSNSATLEATCDGNTVNVTKASASIPVTSTIITKSSQYLAYDHVIKWTVTVNTNKMDINNAIVDDTIPNGLTLLTSGSYAVQPGIGTSEFVDKYGSDGVNDTLRFTLGNLTSANSPVTLVYYTDVPDPTVNAVNDTTTHYYDNTASLTGKTTSGADVNASGYNRATVTSTVLQKTLSYDYTARLATWTITVNSNAMDLPKANITDTIPVGQYIYIPDGKTLQDAVTVKKGAQIVTNKNLTFTPKVEGDETQGGTLECDFTKVNESDTYTITDTYTIVFKTKITDPTAFKSNQTITIANSAKLDNGLVSPITVSPSKTITNKLASKSGTVDNNKGCVSWSVDINTNAAINFVSASLEDDLPDGLDLDTSSIKLIPLTINASNGNLTEGTPVTLTNANVSYNHLTRVFIFTLPPNTQSAYRLKFDTYVVKNINSVTNTVSFSGSSLSQNSSANATGIVFAGAGGGGSGVTGSLTVNKVDADNPSTKLTGAVFQLFDSYGNPYSNQQTVDAYGQIVFSGLTFNTYVLKEITAPDGYLTVPDATIKVDATHKNVNYTCQDPPKKGTVTVIKTDEKGTLLANATFELRDKTGKYAALTATSGANGKAVFNARLGSYTLVETQAPANHLINTTTYDVDITEANYTTAQQYAYADDRMVGSFQVTKYSNKGGTLSGAEFTLYNGTGGIVKAATTLADGTVQFVDIPFGSYTLKETQAPNGYILDSNEKAVTIDVSNYKTLQSFSFTNNKMVGDIEVTKTDLKGVPLAGAEFTLYDGANNAVTTAVSGDDGIADFLNVPFGEYTIKETKAPDEYLVDTKTCPVSVDGLTYLTVQKFTFEDERMLGNIEILKTDKKGLPLANAEFTLFDSKGKIAYKAVSDKDGVAKFTDIFLGTYTLKETKAPAKHVLNTKEYSVTLDTLNYTVTQNFNFTNDIMQGDIKVLKTGYKNALLQGAEFTLYDNDGKEYRSVQSDTNGVALFSGIPYGDYTFKETKAPENYLLNDTIYTVSINETTYSNVQPFSVEDKPMLGKIVVIIKDDKDVPLSGGEFTLQDKDKKPVATSTSGPDGTLSFNDVPVGNYTIKESKAPAGYRLIEDDIQVPLTSANYVQTQQFTVVYDKDDIIHTGDNNLIIILACVGGLLSVCIVIILVITKKRKNGNRFRV